MGKNTVTTDTTSDSTTETTQDIPGSVEQVEQVRDLGENDQAVDPLTENNTASDDAVVDNYHNQATIAEAKGAIAEIALGTTTEESENNTDPATTEKLLSSDIAQPRTEAEQQAVDKEIDTVVSGDLQKSDVTTLPTGQDVKNMFAEIAGKIKDDIRSDIEAIKNAASKVIPLKVDDNLVPESENHLLKGMRQQRERRDLHRKLGIG